MPSTTTKSLIFIDSADCSLGCSSSPCRPVQARPVGVPPRCPRDAPEPPSRANGRHQQQPVNLKLARALKPASNARDTLVMRSSAAPLQSSHLVALWSGSAGRHHDQPDVAPAGTANQV